MSSCARTVPCENTSAGVERRRKLLEEHAILAVSTKLEDSRYATEFIIPDMHCAGCISKIERGLSLLDQVENARANLSRKTVTVVWDNATGSAADIAHAIGKLGFDHHLADADTEDDDGSQSKALLLALAVAGFAAANIMLLSVSVWSGADRETTHLFHLISGLIAVPAVAFSGRPFFRSALRALSVGRLNMDVPISLAVLLALAMSLYESLSGGQEAYFDASVTLLFFLLIGRYLDQMMRRKAQGAVARLSSISAKSGVLVSPQGETSHVPLDQIKPGMRLRIYPGERFPVDGVIVCGASDIDRSHITGESESATANLDTVVEAGTLNLTSAVDMEATSSAEDSFLAEMRKMMDAAEKGRGNYTRIADRMAAIYAPAVHLLALVAFIVWMFITAGEWQTSLYVAIAVLIITCPCALGLAVPVAHVIGANRLMQAGILMRDGTALERLAEVSTVIFDKTGTLTMGSPVVIGTDAMDEQQEAVLKALVANSTHPVAKAANVYLPNAQPACIDVVEEIPGCGLEGIWQGKKVRFGKPCWSGLIAGGRENFHHDCSALLVISGEEPIGLLMRDKTREGAETALDDIRSMRLDAEILSGDRQPKVEEMAAALGIEKFNWDRTPAQKIAHLEDSRAAGVKTLMVGDGINDAPALIAGHVSMVPASASDVGRHSADFVFTRQSLCAVPFAIAVARKTDKIVRQNFALAIVYNCIAVPLAMAGQVTPLFAAIAMSASSIVVVANSFRINLTTHGGARNTDAQEPAEQHQEGALA